MREVDVKSGDVLRTASLDKKDFGEGLTRLGDHLYQLTWQSPKMLVYEVGNFDSIQTKHVRFCYIDLFAHIYLYS